MRLPATRSHPDVESSSQQLPAWPLAALLVGYPLWWILGFGELCWIVAAFVMIAYMVRSGRRRVPPGFGITLCFLLWVLLSVIAIDTTGRLIGFSYRYLTYVATFVIFVYIYNARALLSLDRVLGYLTVFWTWVVAGGYLGLMFPTFVIRTPLAMVLPSSLLQNDLVHSMVIRRLTQFNPDSWAYIDPRPSAPFLYTNNWGNAFSLLLPLIIVYIARLPMGARKLALIAALPISLVPAFLTLNRGMFLGLGVVLCYVALRLALDGQIKALLWLVGVGGVGALMASWLPVLDRLTNRLEISGTNEDRLATYVQTVERVLASPIFGYGGPRPAENVSGFAPPAGTQGQVWLVLFSHGFIGLFLFLAVLIWLTVSAARWRTMTGTVITGTLLAGLVEVFYYGVLGAGLIIMVIIGALAMRERITSTSTPHPIVSPAHAVRHAVDKPQTKAEFGASNHD